VHWPHDASTVWALFDRHPGRSLPDRRSTCSRSRDRLVSEIQAAFADVIALERRSLVQHVMIKCPISCGHGRCVCHELGHRLRGPVERLGVVMPCLDARFKPCPQVVVGGPSGDSSTRPLAHAAPLFHVLHPCAMPRRAREDNARRGGSPPADRWPMRGADVVAHELAQPLVGHGKRDGHAA
jgi:hypothetical protein